MIEYDRLKKQKDEILERQKSLLERKYDGSQSALTKALGELADVRATNDALRAKLAACEKRIKELESGVRK